MGQMLISQNGQKIGRLGIEKVAGNRFLSGMARTLRQLSSLGRENYGFGGVKLKIESLASGRDTSFSA
eukprot:12407196-Karenia_brevis.AAC.1